VEEVSVEEKNKEKTKKKKKIAKDENRKGFADSIKDWLTDKFTEPDLGE
jgi:hypothetical protein